jgi:hypothetical protein
MNGNDKNLLWGVMDLPKKEQPVKKKRPSWKKDPALSHLGCSRWT